MSLLGATLLRGVGVTLFGLILIAALRRRAAATRHAVCAVVLGAALALPLGLLWAPKRTVSVPSAPFGTMAAEALRPVLSEPSVSATATPMREWEIPWDAIFLGVWAVGATIVAGRSFIGWAVALGWARRAVPLETPGTAEGSRAGKRASGRDGSGGGWDVRVSRQTAVPLVVWAGRPVILLPTDHVHWSAARRAAVLAHEAAHVRRGDWNFLVLARAALALHWPNPFVWALVRAARRLAEDAADDAVLREGVAPADYADHLLELARSVHRSALALSMAQRPDVHRRIHRVLSLHRTRGSASPATLVLASLLVGGALVPAACVVLVEPEVRVGPSTAGTRANGFVGRMPDGRPVELVQIVRWTPQGPQAWRPDGTPIPEAARVPTRRPINRRLLTILLRFPSRTPDAWNLAQRASKRLPGDAKELLYALGGDLPGRMPTERQTYHYLGLVSKGDDRASLGFPLNDGPWKTEAAFSPDRPNGGGRVRDVHVGTSETTPATPGGAPPHTGDAKVSTDVTFALRGGTAWRRIRLVAILKDGRRVQPSWNGDGDGRFTAGERRMACFDHARSEIERIEIQTRPVPTVEFYDVRLKPNGRSFG